jgi:hypothetical protein
MVSEAPVTSSATSSPLAERIEVRGIFTPILTFPHQGGRDLASLLNHK